jgi:alkaline phosphatase
MTMKLRNRLIALACLIVFLAPVAIYLLTSSQKKPFAVILFLGDGMSPSVLTASRIFAGGGNGRLEMESLPNVALCRNAANDSSVPEAASASTAIAGGQRVNGGNLCIDPSGTKLPSLLEIAASRGRATGLITSGHVTGVTSAAFYAKTRNAYDPGELTRQFSAHTPFDFVAGGGAEDFETPTAATNSGTPANGTAIADVSPRTAKTLPVGVSLLHTMPELEKKPFWERGPLLTLLAPGDLYPPESVTMTNKTSLSDLVRVAIQHLQSDKDGYLLVVDDPMIGAAAATNDGERMLGRLLAFDQAVATARRYAGENALILVAGRETIGGLQLNGYPLLGDKGVAILAVNAQGNPSLCWSTGPGYSQEEAPVSTRSAAKSGTTNTPASVGILTQSTARRLPSGIGVAGDVVALGMGPGSEKLHGFLDLTDIHRLIQEKL